MSDQYLNYLISQAAGQSNIEPGLLRALLMTESKMNPEAVSHKGARGLGQFTPLTAKQYGLNPKNPNPHDSIAAAGSYLSDLIDRFGGSVQHGLAAYNMGPTALSQSLRTGRRLPAETRAYTQRVQNLAPSEGTKFNQADSYFNKYLPNSGLSPKTIQDLATWRPPNKQANYDFDPESSGYDYESAILAGIKPDPETGHWDSRERKSGLLLKGRQHPAWNELEQGEKDAGYEIYKGQDERYYSKPKKSMVGKIQERLETTPPLSQLLEGAGEKYNQLMKELQAMTPIPGLYWTPPIDQKLADKNWEDFMATRREKKE